MSRLFAAADKADFGDTATWDGLAKATWAAWVYCTSYAADGYIWSKWGVDLNQQTFLFGITSTGKVQLALRNSVTALFNSTTNNAISTHRWYHIAWLLVGGTSQLVYINGVNQAITVLNAGSMDFLPSRTDSETIGRTSNNTGSYVAASEYYGAWTGNLSAGEIGKLAAGADPATIRPASILALPTFNSQGVVYDRKRKVVIKPSGTRPFRDPPRIVRRRVIGLDLGTSPPPPPPSTYIGARFQMIGSGIQQFSGGRAA